MDNRVGKLLIAHPNLPQDNWFFKTVVYIYDERPEMGTLGLALNVPTNLQIKRVAYDKGILYPNPHHLVRKGGPVNDKSIIMLHTDEWEGSNTVSAGCTYKMSSDNHMFERIALGDEPAYWRMFLGICGWAPGQLDMELAGQFPYGKENSWLTADANDHIMFELDGEKQWEAALDLSSSQMINQYL